MASPFDVLHQLIAASPWDFANFLIGHVVNTPEKCNAMINDYRTHGLGRDGIFRRLAAVTTHLDSVCSFLSETDVGVSSSCKALHRAMDSSSVVSEAHILSATHRRQRMARIGLGAWTEAVKKDSNVPVLDEYKELVVRDRRVVWRLRPGDAGRLTLTGPSANAMHRVTEHHFDVADYMPNARVADFTGLHTLTLHDTTAASEEVVLPPSLTKLTAHVSSTKVDWPTHLPDKLHEMVVHVETEHGFLGNSLQSALGRCDSLRSLELHGSQDAYNAPKNVERLLFTVCESERGFAPHLAHLHRLSHLIIKQRVALPLPKVQISKLAPLREIRLILQPGAVDSRDIDEVAQAWAGDVKTFLSELSPKPLPFGPWGRSVTVTVVLDGFVGVNRRILFGVRQAVRPAYYPHLLVQWKVVWAKYPDRTELTAFCTNPDLAVATRLAQADAAIAQRLDGVETSFAFA